METMIERLFRCVLNMSITASFVIAALMLLRLLLKRAPKAISYGVWFVALFRLLCPFSFKSAFSFFGLFGSERFSMEHIPANFGLIAQPQVGVIISAVSDTVNASLPAAVPQASANPMQLVFAAAAWGWLLAAATLMVYSTVSYLLLKRRLLTAVLLEGRIYETDRIASPFVCGFIHPCIYLPTTLAEQEREYIVRHEQAHIHRLDYLVKPLWYFTACLHWFNPLVWVAFGLMGRDMEMSCDEAVVRQMGDQIKTDYSASLLSLTAPTKLLAGSPLAFGENGTKARVKNILSYKKPLLWVITVAIAAALVFSAMLLANPSGKPAVSLAEMAVPVQDETEKLAAKLLQYKTEYVGDNSKVGGILSLLAYPDGIQQHHFALETDGEPYGITIYLKAEPADFEQYGSSKSQASFTKNAYLLLALVGNADHINFVLSDGSREIELRYTRAQADAAAGRDVREFAISAAGLSKLMSAAEPEPAVEEPVYTMMKLGQDGAVLTSRSPLSAEETELAKQSVFNYLVKSSAAPALDIDSMPYCYLIRASFEDGTVSDYYAFQLDGFAYMQYGKSGQYSRLDDTLYYALAAMIDGQESPSGVVQKHLEAQKDTGAVLSMTIQSVSVSPEETVRIRKMYAGSELAEKNGWSDDYIRNNLIAVLAEYTVDYDNTKVPYTEGAMKQYFYMTRKDEQSSWAVWDAMSPSD